MPRILTLNTELAQDLRKKVLTLYQNNTGKPFEPVTYLGSYEVLQKNLSEQLSEEDQSYAQSISPHRLRKLLYYTDTKYTDDDKLEPLTFGSDFIDALEKLPLVDELAVNEISNTATSKKKRNKYVLIAGIALFSITAGLLYKYNQKPYYFRDDFDKNSLEDLRERGWEVMDFDSSLFYPQVDSELTLMTSRGDYWMRGKDTPMIKNFIYHKIDDMNCFEVNFKFRLPILNERYQTGAFFLMDNNLTRDKYLRIGMNAEDSSIWKKVNRAIAIFRNYHQEVAYETMPFLYKPIDNNLDTYFKIIFNNRNITFYYKLKYEYHPFEKFKEIFYIDYTPRFIAFAAFNGYRIGDGLDAPLNTASSVPIYYDWVKVEECK